MQDVPWTKEFPGDITVCDADGVILKMNDRSAETFSKDGGRDLIGTNLLDCHPEPSRTKLKDLLASGQVNAYAIEKDGAKKLIYQAPWYENGEYRGLVEISLPLPETLPHFVRDSA
jgi:transcriptional regulator with PAS, ATPase and Fis domain